MKFLRNHEVWRWFLEHFVISFVKQKKKIAAMRTGTRVLGFTIPNFHLFSAKILMVLVGK